MKAFVSCLFYYDMDVSLVMRFLSNNYTGEHRNVTQIVDRIRPFVDDDLLLHFERVMLSGCPNKMVSETSRENALLYWRKGNNPSIKNNLKKVMNTMNKEERNNFVIPLPSWLARYVPHLFFTPQHNLVKPGKKDRLIFNAAERPTMDAVPVNKMTSTKHGTELDCLFGDVKTKILSRAWNLRISFPDKDIIIHANDVKSCFRQLKHHPNVMGAFSFIIGQILFLQCGLTFGADFSPANWEVPRRIAEQLAEALFQDKSLPVKHRKYLDRLIWDVTLGSPINEPLTPASPDTLNTGVLDRDGNPINTPHHFFVDDGVYAEIFDKIRIEQAIASSIEAIFILLGHSDTSRRQDPISFDKMEDMVISYANKVLGQLINTRTMEVETPKEFIVETLNIIQSMWHSKRKRFHLSEVEIITGRLCYIAETSPWLKFMTSHLYTSIAHALRSNRHHLISTNAEFRAMLKLQKQADASELHASFALTHTARAVHSHKKSYNFNSTLKEELKLITAALSSDWVPTKRPIAHLIPRDPNGTSDSDSSLDSAGGFSFDMFYWWYLEWPPAVKQFTLKYIKSSKDGALISINVLEYAALIINFVAATHFFTKVAPSCANPSPTVMLFADNTTAEAWITKACKNTLEGRALGRLQCALMINNPVGINIGHVTSKDNEIADRISRFKNTNAATLGFPKLAQEFPQLMHCSRFHPSAELISFILDALLLKKCTNPLLIAQQLLADPGRITT